jgi:hypothetical protein
VRFALTVVLWLATTAALAVVVPGTWLQKNVINADGYAALAQQAAGDPALQSAMAGELTTRAMALIAEHGGGRNPADGSQVHDVIAAFTAGPAFPPLFARANRAAHSWLFTSPQSGQGSDQWMVDLAPMLNESSVQQMLSDYNVKAPAKLTVPLTSTSEALPQSLRQGRLSRLATWGPWVSIGAAAASAFCGLLMLVAARRRGKALTSIGVSALLIGAAGWAGIEIAGRPINNALNRTTGDIRGVGEVMVRHEASLHQWLNLTLIAGAALVVLGVVVAVVGGLRKRP